MDDDQPLANAGLQPDDEIACVDHSPLTREEIETMEPDLREIYESEEKLNREQDDD